MSISTTTMMKEAIQALYPPRPAASRRRVRRCGSSSSSSFGSFRDNSIPARRFGGPDGVGDAAAPSAASGRGPSFGSSSKRNAAKSRFSELLLEHGEADLHRDWAVRASSSSLLPGGGGDDDDGRVGGGGVVAGGGFRMKQMEGRLRICSRSIVFEPRQTSRGIVRVPFRHMTVCPFLGGGNGSASGINGPDSTGGFLDASRNDRANSFGSVDARQGMAAVLRCDRHVVMKANNVIGPYEDVEAPVEFRFVFQHSSPTSMISIAKKLFEAEVSDRKHSSVSFAPNVAFDTASAPPIIPLPSSSDDNNPRDAIVDQILSRAASRPFDTANFLHVSERPLTPNLRCSIKTPLLERRGCGMLTEHGFYFQPIVPGSTDDGGVGSGSARVGPGGKAHVWLVDDVRAIARRYDGMKDRGLEIYTAKQHSVLLAFESAEARERVVLLLSRRVVATRSLPLTCFTDRSFVESALELWQAGGLDNFEYLLCLNSAAGRSFHDLSRYPVFPWVLSDYGEGGEDDDDDDDALADDPPTALDFTDPGVFRDLSKPVGALNEERLAGFLSRYKSMVQQQKSGSQQNQDAPFMYGTHYSAPGYALFYLLRVMPEHMLLLQNGKFDVPDRLFHSIDATYKSVLTNPADVKELIPEFFDPDCFDFLINSMGMGLGNLQTGERVNDVLLPRWAKKSAKRFLRRNRAALESDHCAERLPAWIDLIFGVASRGPGARDARNLFHPASYVGPEECEAVRDPEERARTELQATEFGVVPDQLFRRRHPGRGENVGGWGDADALLARDRLRESYGVGDAVAAFSAPGAAKGRSGFSVDQSLAQNIKSASGPLVGANPFG